MKQEGVTWDSGGPSKPRSSRVRRGASLGEIAPRDEDVNGNRC